MDGLRAGVEAQVHGAGAGGRTRFSKRGMPGDGPIWSLRAGLEPARPVGGRPD